ncbi:hypothetical protein [Chitinophaga sp.]|uniref:hypothetical protein n=1 Tax=Chitinophaga sp. TaxID=1869181 RepID=UPI002F95F9BB
MAFFLFWLLPFLTGDLQQNPCIKWNTAKNFDFYCIPDGKAPERMTWEEIDKLKHVRLNQASSVLTKSTCKPAEALIWMETYLLVVEFSAGQRKKLRVSNYGGFLSDLGGRFYYVQEADQQKWLDILAEFRHQVNAQH